MKTKLVNIIGLIASLVIFLVLLTSFVKGLSRIREGEKIINKNKVNLLKIEAEKNKLEDQLKVSESNEYIEKQLRNKMGLVKEGEMVIVLPEASIVKKLSPTIPEPEEIKPKANWQKWLELFK